MEIITNHKKCSAVESSEPSPKRTSDAKLVNAPATPFTLPRCPSGISVWRISVSPKLKP
jgi:hypothetical protein